MMTAAELWLDPVCPWAWSVWRWLAEVEHVRDVRMRPHVMSLAVLNENRTDLTEVERSLYTDAWAPVRVVMVTALSLGEGAVRELYVALAPLIHVERMPAGRDMFALALGRAGLPHSLANAAGDSSYDEAIRASHHAGADALGEIAACPVLQLPGPDGEPVAAASR